jgi:hypothetical protein
MDGKEVEAFKADVGAGKEEGKEIRRWESASTREELLGSIYYINVR